MSRVVVVVVMVVALSLSLSLCTVKLSSALGEFKYFGLKEMIVGGCGFMIMLGALCMKFKGGLKALESLIDLEFTRGINLLVEALLGFDIDRCEGRLLFIVS